jgi:hypothetical protein
VARKGIVTPTYTTADLQALRQSIRESTREVEETHFRELDRAGAGLWAMKAPARREREAQRFGGGYRSRGASDYDWFYGLHPNEQARLRANWLSTSSNAQSPDEIAQHMPISEWLEHTRAIDASRALRTGRGISSERYGSLNPNHLIEGAPFDVRLLWGDDDKALAHLQKSSARGFRGGGLTPSQRFWGYEPDQSQVQYRTGEKDGHPYVYPISPPKPKEPTHYVNAYGQRIERPARDYADEPAF